MKLWVSSCFRTRANSERDAAEALDWDADAAVVDGAGPAGGAGDVGEGLAGVEDYADGFGRGVVELGFDVVEIVFEGVQDSAGEIGRGGAAVFQGEVSGDAFAVAFLFGFVFLRFGERALDFRVGVQVLGALPFFHCEIHFVEAVVGPAGELCDVGRIGGDAAGVLERVEGGGELALAQEEHG